MLVMLETQCRKGLAWMNSQLETLETQQITYSLAPLSALPLLWMTITLHPP